MALVLSLDAGTKYLAYLYLPHYESFSSYPYGGIGIFQDFLGVQFSLNYATNTGAAWGLFSNYSLPLLYLRMGLIVWLGAYFYRLPAKSPFRLPLSLIIAGAVGNVIDIFLYGHVIDMFHWILWGYDYPVFYIADSAVCIGVVLYLFHSFAASHASSRST